MGKCDRNDNIRLQALRAALDRVTLAEALNLVEAWNAKLAERATPQFPPTIGCAINAGMPWRRLHCPGCQQTTYLGLRRIVRPRDDPITALKLTCQSMCRGQAPRPRLIGWFTSPEILAGSVYWVEDGNERGRPTTAASLICRHSAAGGH